MLNFRLIFILLFSPLITNSQEKHSVRDTSIYSPEKLSKTDSIIKSKTEQIIYFEKHVTYTPIDTSRNKNGHFIFTEKGHSKNLTSIRWKLFAETSTLQNTFYFSNQSDHLVYVTTILTISPLPNEEKYIDNSPVIEHMIYDKGRLIIVLDENKKEKKIEKSMLQTLEKSNRQFMDLHLKNIIECFIVD